MSFLLVVVAELQTRHLLLQVKYVGQAKFFQLVARQSRHADGNIEDALLSFLRGDNDFFDVAFAFIWALGERDAT